MKQIIMVGAENADKAERLYFRLLDNYPRKIWAFSIKTIENIPTYKFTLSGKSEEVFRRKEWMNA